MLKYTDYTIVFQEVPDEVSLQSTCRVVHIAAKGVTVPIYSKRPGKS